MMCIVLKLIKY